MLAVRLYHNTNYYIFQIIHLRDFEYWRIFQGLTAEEMKQREENYEYPPRLQLDCTQLDNSKSLLSSFVVSKKFTAMEEKEVAQFKLNKKVAGT